MAPTSQGPDAAQTIKAIITFLAIPPEVRLMVYRCLVPSRFVFDLRHEASTWLHGCRYQHACRLLDIGVMRTHPVCQQEVAAMLYSTNTFMFYSSQVAREWFDGIGAGNAQLVRQCEIPSGRTGRTGRGRCHLAVNQIKENIELALHHQPPLQSLTLISCGPPESSSWNVTDLRIVRAVQAILPSLAKAYVAPYPVDKESAFMTWNRPSCRTMLRLTIESEGPKGDELEVDLKGEWDRYWARITAQKQANIARLRMEEANSRLGASISQMDDATSQMEDATSQMQDSTSQMQDSTSQMEESNSQEEDSTSQTEDPNSQPDQSGSQMEE